jgi:type IV secretory pathway VirB4 component
MHPGAKSGRSSTELLKDGSLVDAIHLPGVCASHASTALALNVRR